jgi:opacity protein-like surface antigen
MKRFGTAILVGAVAALVAGFPSSAAAQARGYLLLGGGLSIPVGDYKDTGAKTGWLGQIAGGVTSGVIGGRINGTFMRNGFDTSSEHFRILGAMADVTISPKMTGKVAPYLLAGIGVQNGKSTTTGAESDTKFAWNAGAGLGLSAGSVGLFLEARFLSVNTPGNKTNLIPISAGIKLGGH